MFRRTFIVRRRTCIYKRFGNFIQQVAHQEGIKSIKLIRTFVRINMSKGGQNLKRGSLKRSLKKLTLDWFLRREHSGPTEPFLVNLHLKTRLKRLVWKELRFISRTLRICEYNSSVIIKFEILLRRFGCENVWKHEKQAPSLLYKGEINSLKYQNHAFQYLFSHHNINTKSANSSGECNFWWQRVDSLKLSYLVNKKCRETSKQNWYVVWVSKRTYPAILLISYISVSKIETSSILSFLQGSSENHICDVASLLKYLYYCCLKSCGKLILIKKIS